MTVHGLANVAVEAISMILFFAFPLKIVLSFGNHFFIGPKSLSLEHFFQVIKEPLVAGGQTWRVWLARKQFGAKFIQFDHRFHGLVARYITLKEQHFSHGSR